MAYLDDFFRAMGFSSSEEYWEDFNRFRDEMRKERANRSTKILDSIVAEDIPIPDEMRKRDVKKENQASDPNILDHAEINGFKIIFMRIDFIKGHQYYLSIARSDKQSGEDMYLNEEFEIAARTYLSVLKHLKKSCS